MAKRPKTKKAREPKGDPKLAKAMKDARIQAGMSQGAVSAASGIGKARVSRYENGWVLPSIDSLEAVGEAVGTPASVLLKKAGR